MNQIENAETYSEWVSASTQLDRFASIYFRLSILNALDLKVLIKMVNFIDNLGKTKWKLNNASKYYDYELINSRLIQLQTARELNDSAATSFLLRTSKIFLMQIIL